jgi:hypothetical protein
LWLLSHESEKVAYRLHALDILSPPDTDLSTVWTADQLLLKEQLSNTLTNPPTRLSDDDWRLINIDLDRDRGWFRKFSISKFQVRYVASSS